MHIIGDFISCISVIGLSFLGFQGFAARAGLPGSAFDILDPLEGLILIIAVELHRQGLSRSFSSLRLLNDLPVARLAIDPGACRAELICTASSAHTFLRCKVD